MKVLLSAVAEPQICFPNGLVTLCNYIIKNDYAIMSDKGKWMAIPRHHPAKDEDEIKKKKKPLSLAA